MYGIVLDNGSVIDAEKVAFMEKLGKTTIKVYFSGTSVDIHYISEKDRDLDFEKISDAIGYITRTL